MQRSGEDMRVHTRRQGRVALAGRMLIAQGHINIAMPAPVEQLSESCALLRKNREARVPEVMELEPVDAGIRPRALPRPAEGIRVKRQTGRPIRAEEPGRSVRLDIGIKVPAQGRD